MNSAFISEIFAVDEALFMQSETEGLTVNIEISDTQRRLPGNLKLFEEFSGKSIAETTNECRMIFDKSDDKTRREKAADIEREVERFRDWLEETKNIGSERAHYYSVGLKSLLFGLPIGEQVAYLFGAILDSQPK
jgi:hypothetical protein